MKKLTKIFLSSVISIILFSSCVIAEALPSNGKNYVDDQDNILSDNTEIKLEKELSQLSQQYGCDIVIVTFKNFNDHDFMSFVNDYYDQRGFDSDGIIYAVSSEYGYAQVNTHGTIQNSITNYGTDYLIDELLPILSDGNYDKAALKFVNLSEQFLKQAVNGSPYSYDNKIVTINQKLFYLVISVVVSLIIAWFILNSMKNAMNTARAVDTAHDFVDKNNIITNNNSDTFLYSTLTRVPIPKKSSSGGGGGGGSRGGSGGRF